VKSSTYTLDTPIDRITRLDEDHKLALKRLRLHTVKDLLYHFPVRYEGAHEAKEMDSLKEGEEVILHGMMQKVQVRRSFRGHIPMTEAKVAGERGTVRCVWFNQAYIGKMYPEGSLVKVAGTVHQDSKGFSLSNPRIEKVNDIIQASPQSLFAEGVGIEFLMPVYRETKGITSQYLYYLIKRIHALKVFESVEDPIPELITEKLHLPKLKEALLYIHFPKKQRAYHCFSKTFFF
jgi:ATP-dependent DNA helicase RecG